MRYYTRTENDKGRISFEVHYGKIAFDSIMLILGLTLAAMVGCPAYNVWHSKMEGEAEYQKAEQNRRVLVLEAQAKRDSATLQAEAEVERAKGVAKANAIVADGLKDHEEYLRYLWIDKVAGNAGHEVIYVPTEAGLPILEATRRAAAQAGTK